MVASATCRYLARRAADFGVRIGGAITVDMRAVKARKEAVSGKSRDGVERWLRGMERCTVYHEQARFLSAHEIQAGLGDADSRTNLYQRRRPRRVPADAGMDTGIVSHQLQPA